jgi:hypothetical protein
MHGVVLGLLLATHVGPPLPVQSVAPLVHTLPVMHDEFCVHATQVPFSQTPLLIEAVVQAIPFG